MLERLIAGPCSAESEEQVLTTARELADLGVKTFRAGVWKPRTKPGGFEGRGAPALEWLRKVKKLTGMAVITEVATPRHLEQVVEAGLDGVWIGARTTANPFAVQELADAMACLNGELKTSFSVLIKNPVNPDLELWIGAIERVAASGMERIGTIHRGFSSYGKHLYRNQPRWAIPIELHRRMPHLPILLDPSHIGGRRDFVAPLIRQAVDMDYAGFFVEVHSTPDEALSDAAQQITPRELAQIISNVKRRHNDTPEVELEILRKKIDDVDDSLLELLAKRMEISREIGKYKLQHSIPVLQSHRYKRLMERRLSEAGKLGLTPEFVGRLLAAIHEESVRQQLS